MNSGRRHLFHIVDASPWPLISAFSAFFMLSGMAFYMHRISFGGFFFFFGLVSLSFAIYF